MRCLRPLRLADSPEAKLALGNGNPHLLEEFLRNNIKFDDWMRLDLRYIDNWSIGLDLHLILKTVPVVLVGRGAS